MEIRYVSFLTGLCWFTVLGSSLYAQDVVIKSDKRILTRSDYDYAPSVMVEADKYKMYWCAKGVRGDEIFYSQSRVGSSLWSKPVSVFAPAEKVRQHFLANNPAFDGLHVCDPSVVRVRDKYYLYYGGLSEAPGASKKCQTKIGVAESYNGIDWSRMNKGKPIVLPERACPKNQYGVGQPSVVYKDGYFYMAYTDTSGFRSNPKNGAGLYLIRSKKPTFENREVATNFGWRLVTRSVKVTNHKLVDGFSVDMLYSDLAKNFVLALHYNSRFTTIRSYDDNFKPSKIERRVDGQWRDGPGLVRKPNGHAIPSSSCDVLPLSMVRSKGGKSPATWDLYFADVSMNLLENSEGCTADRVQNALSGYVVTSKKLPAAMVTKHGRIQLDSLRSLQGSNYSSITISNDLYRKLTYLGDIKRYQSAIVGKNLPNAILTTLGHRVQYQCSAPVLNNQSPQSWVTPERYHSYPLAGEVFCE